MMFSQRFIFILVALKSDALSNAFVPTRTIFSSPSSSQRWGVISPNNGEDVITLDAGGDNMSEDNSSSSSTTKVSSASKNERKARKMTTSLHFTGENVYKSDPMPIMHSHPSDLSSFFASEEVRSFLLNGDRENSIERISDEKIDDRMVDLWMKQCKIVGGEMPSVPGDCVFQVNTGTMNFSGLNISSNSLVGVKYLDTPNGDGAALAKPEYQLVFIKDSPIVKGPRLLVWIYNQLTGQNKQTEDGNTDNDQTVRALSRFTYEATPDGDSIIFALESKLEVIVKFPSLLLKILPVSKEKAEEQGSASVLKAIGKDIEAVLPKVRNFYLETFEENKL